MKRKSIFVLFLVLALLTIGLSAQIVMAQTGTPAPGGSGTNVVTLAAGESAAIPANFWCLDYGKPFPTGITGPSDVAPAKVAGVLAAAKEKGTIDSNPYQTQLAVWYASDGTWHDTGKAGHVLAQQLVDAASSATAAPAADTQSLGALMSQGGLTVTVQSFQAVADNTSGIAVYHGTGNLLVKNSSSQSVSFVLDGAVFQPTTAGAQTLFAQTANTPVIVPTATVAPTVAPTATVAPTVAPTATVVPTVAPTATVAPTVAAVAVATATPAAPQVLPVTGGTDPSGWLWLILLVGALTLFAGARLATQRARR